MEYLRGVTDDVAKADVVQRISDLAERYAPDTQWFIDTMNQAGPQPVQHCPDASLRTCSWRSRCKEMHETLLGAHILLCLCVRWSSPPPMPEH